MRKKILTILLSITMALSVSACGASDISKEDYDAAIVENAKLKEELEKKNEESVSKSEYDALVEENENLKKQVAELESKASDSTDAEVSENTEESATAEQSVEPIHLSVENPYPVVYDKNGIKVTINSFSYSNNKTVYKMTFLIENGTDNDVTVSLSDVDIDNFEISSTTSMNSVSAGKNGTMDSSIWQDSLDEVNITEWSSFNANIEISNGLFSDAIDKIPITVDKECWTLAE